MKGSMLCVTCLWLINLCLSAADETGLHHGKTGTGKKVIPYRWVETGEGDSPALILFLHGMGERGKDNHRQMKHGIPSLLRWLKKENKHCVLVVPQCPGDATWASTKGSHKDADRLKLNSKPSYPMGLVLSLLDEILKKHRVNKSQIYITGLSMGGYGTFDALAWRPNFFAAAIPICGGGDKKTADKIKHVPMWVFHGDADSVVPPTMSRAMVKALENAGGTPKYTEYKGVRHNSWSATYANPEVWNWLFAQKK